jgi:hypothetical protein
MSEQSQRGDDNLAVVDQTFFFNFGNYAAQFQGLYSGGSPIDAFGNSAYINQAGAYNSATQWQAHNANTATSMQAGLGNVSFQVQLWDNNNAVVNQYGEGNYGEQVQGATSSDPGAPAGPYALGDYSDDNFALLYQDGSFNSSYQQQEGFGNSSTVTQMGTGHTSFTFQSGTGNVATVTQND